MISAQHKFRNQVLRLLALISFAAVPAAQAQSIDDMSLEQLLNLDRVIGASKYEQKVSDAPADVTIVTAEEIKKYGYRNFFEILSAVRGIYLTDDRNYNYIGVRGFNRPGDYNGRILVTLNGHRINENVYDSTGYAGDEPVAINLIERIEVIRGPASSLYGSNAFFGVINIVTTTGAKVDGVKTAVWGGSYDAIRGDITYGKKYDNGHDAVLGLSYYDIGGQELDIPTFGKTDDTDWERVWRAFGSYQFADFKLFGNFYRRQKGVPNTAYGSDFDNAGNMTHDERALVELTHDLRLSDTYQLSSRLYYDWYNFYQELYYSGVANHDVGIGGQAGLEMRLTSDFSENHKFIFGGEYRASDRQKIINYDEHPYFSYLDHSKTSNAWALFAQDEYKFNQTFALNLGLRYDDISYVKDAFAAPRVGLIIKGDETTTYKVLYGDAFRAPNQYELYYDAPAFAPPYLPNPDLEPESIKTYELVADSNISSNMNIKASLFYYQVKNLISQVNEAGSLIFRNASDDVEAKGGELELSYKQGRQFEGRLSFTSQSVVNKRTEDTLSNSPKSMGKLNLSTQAVPYLVISTDMQYLAATQDVANQEVGSYFVTGLGIRNQPGVLMENLDLSLRISNLLDREYYYPVSDNFSFTPVAVKANGVNGEVKLEYKF